MNDRSDEPFGLGLEGEYRDVIVLHNGSTLETHGRRLCHGPYCCIHKPSDHPLNNRPLIWRDDSPLPFMERKCVHGIGHPDPDSLAYLRWAIRPQYAEMVEGLEIHGCDGCCHG